MIVKGREYVVQMRGKHFHCAMDITMEFIGGKWKTVILWYLKSGTKRFGALSKLIPDITEKMLSIQLKHLEESGLVERRSYAEVPPRVEYSLTALGRSLTPVLDAIASWGRQLGDAEGRLLQVKKRSPGRNRL
jgi:DNA-binding HxlR family transcriptional regulator